MQYRVYTSMHARAKRTIASFLILFTATLQAADTKLIDAVKRSDAAAVKTLVTQNADVKAAGLDGTTALHWAAEQGNVAIADMLLNAGADAKAANRYSITPMALAAENGHAAVIERL